MTGPSNPPPGGHDLGATFGAPVGVTPARALKPRRRRSGLIWTGVGIVLVACTCAAVQVGANLGYDDALVSLEAAVDQAKDSSLILDQELIALDGTLTVASGIADTDSGTLMDAASKDALVAVVDEAQTTVADGAAVREQDLPSSDEKPTWAWELFGETTQLNSDRDEADDLNADFEAAGEAAASAADAVGEAGATAVASAADAAAAFEAAHISARNLDIIALRSAAEQVRQSDGTLDETAAAAYADLEAAASRMLVSEQAELADKSGPLYNARLEIEAFARSLAPGVLLDFDWSELVNGYGYADSMGGFATWWYHDPGYATIELSNSVAAYWPGARSQALVAHEVGHAISVKCDGMYDDSTAENIEAWATAWAISMGFNDVANGTSAYGAPPQSMIDAAAACR
ncbi:hypothetical protein [Microbacterium sp. AK031]|uniref:hypothetical protein n=1 Tax=Microbacterium sp. AK031 TaxID=2723076 RepID=UPI0021699403|nr:hypothetical protein [Microbacterium sp. AK031]MCS3843895.1 hypothetical protein [Microbacterium sp. AK031]